MGNTMFIRIEEIEKCSKCGRQLSVYCNECDECGEHFCDDCMFLICDEELCDDCMENKKSSKWFCYIELKILLDNLIKICYNIEN